MRQGGDVRLESCAVLVVDDEAGMREMLLDVLALHGVRQVRTAASIAAARAELDAARGSAGIDAMLLDVSLPDGDGRDFCARLRQSGVSFPILMLTGHSQEAELVRGLQCGANDYIAKPFRMHELVARLRAQLRDHQCAGDASFRIGHYVFRPGAKRLEAAGRGRTVFLTSKETAIMKVLCRAAGRVVRSAEILQEIWDYGPDIDTHTLETHIYRLRRKIEPDSGEARILLRATGGYRLNMDDVPLPSLAERRAQERDLRWVSGHEACSSMQTP